MKHSRVALLESQQNNTSNPEAHSEPCQTSIFCKNSQQLKAVNYFCKSIHFR